MPRLAFVFAVCALSILTLVTPRAHAPVTAQSPQAAGDDTARINTWFEAKFKEQLAFSPIQQTFLGQKTGELDDMSIAAQDQQLAWRRATTTEMRKSFDYAKLSSEAQTSYDIWLYQLEQAEAAVRFRTNAYVFDQMSAVHSFLPQLLIAFHRVDDVSDMEGYINRIRESGRALRQLTEISKKNATTGVRPPRFAYDFVIDESTKIITGAPFTDGGPDSAVWADAKAKIAALQKKGALSDARAKAMLADVQAALTGPFKAGLRLADRMAAGRPQPDAGTGGGSARVTARRGVLRRAPCQSDHHDADRRSDSSNRTGGSRPPARRDGGDQERSRLQGRPAGVLRGTARQQG